MTGSKVVLAVCAALALLFSATTPATGAEVDVSVGSAQWSEDVDIPCC